MAEALDCTSESPFHAVAAWESVQVDESEVSLWLKHINGGFSFKDRKAG